VLLHQVTGTLLMNEVQIHEVVALLVELRLLEESLLLSKWMKNLEI
jgi:hypothetical protein